MFVLQKPEGFQPVGQASQPVKNILNKLKTVVLKMPLYEYNCKSCGKNFDKITRYGTPDVEIVCPGCGKNESKRKLSCFSFGSKSSSGEFKSAPSSGGCSCCSGRSCSSCH